MNLYYALGGIGIVLAVVFFAVCVHAETISASITVVDAISTDVIGDAVPVLTDDGSLNFKGEENVSYF